MTSPSRTPRLQPPGRFVFAALLLTLGLAVVLGMNVLVTARYHRSVAEGVLRDYAAFAAGELESRVQTALAQRFFPIMSTLAAKGAERPGARLPLPADIASGVMDTAIWRPIAENVTLFRLAPGDSVETTGAPLAEAERLRLSDSLPALAHGLSRRAYFLMHWLPQPGGSRVAVFTRNPDTTRGVGPVYGFVMNAAALPALIGPALARAPLLPSTLTRGQRLDSAVAYRIVQPDGVPLVASASLPAGPFSASRVLDPMWGGLSVDVALRPSLASRLVIGGVPRSRLPLVLALLALTTVLVVSAATQLRRERELALLREEFVAGASHEFRTPLAQIRLFTETLRLGRVRNEAERDRSLEIIDQETRRLSHLVENLLYVSRIGRGVLNVTPRVRDVAAELRDAVEGFGPIAAARQTRVTLDAPNSLDANVDGDAFRQIVLNLLDNAVKYGPSGQTVTVHLGSRNGQFRLTVDDQGPGVPPRERIRVFERFVRLERDREANTTGTGLGLALVQELARLHGGTAWAEAAPGGGARLVVEWPSGMGA